MKSIQTMFVASIVALAFLDTFVWTIGTKRFLKANNAKLSITALQDFINARRLAREQSLSPWFLKIHVGIWILAMALFLTLIAICINLR